MSIQAVSWALSQDIDAPAVKLLLVSIANYADDNGECWPSQKSLASDTSMSARSVQRHMKTLEDLGYIETEARRTENGARTSNAIRLVTTAPPPTNCRTPPRQRCQGAYDNSVVPPTTTVSHTIEPSIEPSLNRQSKTKGARASRLPDDWKPDEKDLAFARENGLTPPEIAGQADQFRDYWHARAGPQARKLDWNATWRNWIRRYPDYERNSTRKNRTPSPDSRRRSPQARQLDAFLQVGAGDTGNHGSGH